MSISDEQLMAYADGELDDQQRSAIDAALAQDATLLARLEQHRALRSRLQSAYAPALEEPVPHRLLALLPSGVPAAREAQLLPFKARAAAPAQRSSSSKQRWPLWGALAASLMVAVMAGMLTRSGRNRIRLELVEGSMVARGPLAEALNTQLAATQDATGPIRLNLSYRDRAGNYCRVFTARSTSELSGVACRHGADWQLQLLTAATSASAAPEYRQAGSALSGAVLTLVQSQMSGEALDGEAEAKAASSGWR